MFRPILTALVITLMPHAVQAQAPAPKSSPLSRRPRHRRSHRAILAGGDAPVSGKRRSGRVRGSLGEAFDDLKAGDVVTVRYAESVVVQVRPGAALSDARDVTAEAQKGGKTQVIQQVRAVVTSRGSIPRASRSNTGRRTASRFCAA
jgi:hypothetical protein